MNHNHHQVAVNTRGLRTKGEVFQKALPSYHWAMTMYASALRDLNSSGAHRLTAMDWLVNGDDGLAQAKEMANWIARVHNAALLLDSDLADSIGNIKVLAIEGGGYARLSDMTNAEETLRYLMLGAGIHNDAKGPVLANTAEARICRSRSCELLKSTSLEVSKTVKHFLETRGNDRPLAAPANTLPSNMPSL